MKQFFRRKSVLGVIVLIIVTILFLMVFRDSAEQESLSYTFATVETGDIRRIVSASGTISPLVTVEVGSQLSGQIAELNVDFNSVVKKGDVLARIDPASFQARYQQTRAELEVAKSNVAVSDAGVTQAEATMRRDERELGRKRALVERGHIYEAELDIAQVTYENAVAQLEIAKAQLVNARAVVIQREATVEQTRVDLERTDIRSPIDGIVIERAIDIGQTVAASFQAPVLFRIAENLRRIQVEADVDEADIGQLRQGRPVSFRVDAHPDERFTGEVAQIRMSPEEIQNVITYTVIIFADNPDLKLLPGMTANVEIITGERRDVLRVANGALRFRPRTAPPRDGAIASEGLRRSMGSQVWILNASGEPEPRSVQTGLADMLFTEITLGEVGAGDQVIVRASRISGDDEEGRFPRPPRRAFRR